MLGHTTKTEELAPGVNSERCWGKKRDGGTRGVLLFINVGRSDAKPRDKSRFVHITWGLFSTQQHTKDAHEIHRITCNQSSL